MNNKYVYFPKYHPNRQSYDRWVDKVGQKRYDTQNKCDGFKNVKSMSDLYDDYMNSHEYLIKISEIRK